MSTQRQRQPHAETADAVTDDVVVEHLARHPDFFERHPKLLAGLKLPHRTGGAAVSLVERQVAILRQRNTKLERKLRELVSVARSNEALSAKIHTLSLALMDARTLRGVLERLHESLREEFDADRATLVLFDDEADYSSVTSLPFVRAIGRGDAAVKAFETFLNGARPRCGQMRDAQREFLFGIDNVAVGSAALVPLGERSKLGLLAIGSQDAAHFHPAMSTDFLARLGDVVGVAVSRHAAEAAAA